MAEITVAMHSNMLEVLNKIPLVGPEEFTASLSDLAKFDVVAAGLLTIQMFCGVRL